MLPLIKRTKPEKKRRIPKWVERLIGHVIALLIFAFVGYLMISHVRPDLFPRLFGGSAASRSRRCTEAGSDPAP